MENEMKYVKPNPAKCKYALECMKTCAKKTRKSDNPAMSAILVAKGGGGKININVCNQCGTCIDICPTGAISRSKTGAVLIDRKKCVGCYACVEYCPTKSMRVVEGELAPFKCISCGACVKACPSGALEMSEGTFEKSYTERGTPGEAGETFPKKYF
jgi:anaerobic carbon-monoxide dehydrogenase iron sulfur subunit